MGTWASRVILPSPPCLGPVVQSPFGLQVPSGANDQVGGQGSGQRGSSSFLSCREAAGTPHALLAPFRAARPML